MSTQKDSVSFLKIALQSSPGDFSFWISIVAVIQKYNYQLFVCIHCVWCMFFVAMVSCHFYHLQNSSSAISLSVFSQTPKLHSYARVNDENHLLERIIDVHPTPRISRHSRLFRARCSNTPLNLLLIHKHTQP